MNEAPKLTDTIRLRVPDTLKPRLRAIAKFKGTKYQHESRMALTRFADQEELAHPEITKSAKKK